MNDGNILRINEITLGVADACSGIRSITVVFTLTFLFIYLFRTGFIGGIMLMSITLPITLGVNSFRIILIAFFLYRFNFDMTRGALHEGLGLLVFVLIMVALFLSWWFIHWILTGKFKLSAKL